MAPLKILICGGGLAGNALAFWLSKLGHDVTVVERWPSLRATGLQIDLRGSGIKVLKRMGLEEAFRARSVQEQGLEFVNSSGKQKAYFPANKTGQGLQSFTTDYEIMRGDLCRLFHDATKDRVKYIFGMTVKSFEENPFCMWRNGRNVSPGHVNREGKDAVVAFVPKKINEHRSSLRSQTFA